MFRPVGFSCSIGISLLSGIQSSLLAWGLAAAPITDLTFSPKGEWVVFHEAQQGRILGLNDQGKVEVSLPCPLERVETLVFQPGSSLLAVGGGLPGSQGEVRFLDLQKGELSTRISGMSDSVTELAFDPAGRHLAVASADRTIRILTLEGPPTGKEVTLHLQGHSKAVLAVAFSPDGSLLISGGADRTLKVWNARTGELIRSLGNHTDTLQDLAFRPARTFQGQPLPAYCASVSEDLTLRIWQPGIGRMVRIIRHPESPPFAAVWHPDGNSVFSIGQDGRVRQFEGDSDRLITQWQAHPEWCYTLAIHPEGTSLATGDWAGEVALWTNRAGGWEPAFRYRPEP